MKLDDYLSQTGISRGDFAKRVKLSEAALSRYIKERRTPEPDVMRRIHVETGGCVAPNDFVLKEHGGVAQ